MSQRPDTSKVYAPWLWILTCLFAFRVVAQPLALIWNALPSFNKWQSGAMPYAWLLCFQLVILAVMIGTSVRFSRGGVRASHRLGRALAVFGFLYLAVMLMRLALGQTLMQEHFWFDRPLPTVFHLVLASFVITAGMYHLKFATKDV